MVVTLCSVVEVSVVGVVVKGVVARRRAGAFVYRSRGDSWLDVAEVDFAPGAERLDTVARATMPANCSRQVWR